MSKENEGLGGRRILGLGSGFRLFDVEEADSEVFGTGKDIIGVGTPVQAGNRGITVSKSAKEVEGEEFAAECRGAPNLDELAGGNCNEGGIRGEAEGGYWVLEGDAMENNTTVDIDEEGAGGVVDGDKEDTIGGDGDPGDVGGALTGKSLGLGFGEVCNCDSVTDRR